MSKKVNEEARSGDRPELDAEVARSGDRPELDAEVARSGDRPELDAEVARSGDRAELVVEAARSGDRPELVASPREKAWTETVWGTHVRWACRLCPFDTLDGEEAAAEHFRVEHAPPPPPVVERIQVYDRWGNAV